MPQKLKVDWTNPAVRELTSDEARKLLLELPNPKLTDVDVNEILATRPTSEEDMLRSVGLLQGPPNANFSELPLSETDQIMQDAANLTSGKREAGIEGYKDAGQMLAATGAGIGIGVASSPYLSPAGGYVVGNAAASTVDELINKLRGNNRTTSLIKTFSGDTEPSMLNVPLGTMEGILGGKLAEGGIAGAGMLARGGKELLKKGSVVSSKLNQTLSQHFKYPFISDFIERTMAPRKTAIYAAKQTPVVTGALDELIENLTTINTKGLTTEQVSNRIATVSRQNYGEATAIAKAMEKDMVAASQTLPPVPMLQVIRNEKNENVLTHVVGTGAMNPLNTRATVGRLRQPVIGGVQSPVTPDNPKNALLATLDAINSKLIVAQSRKADGFNPDLLNKLPVNIDTMHSILDDLDGFVRKNFDAADDPTKALFYEVKGAVEDDLRMGFANWRQQGVDVQDIFDASREIRRMRDDAFFPTFKTTGEAGDFVVENVPSNLKAIDDIFATGPSLSRYLTGKKEVERLINLHEMRLPNGAVPKLRIPKEDGTREMGALYLRRLFEKNLEKTEVQDAFYNVQKIVSEIDSPEQAAVTKLLFKDTEHKKIVNDFILEAGKLRTSKNTMEDMLAAGKRQIMFTVGKGATVAAGAAKMLYDVSAAGGLQNAPISALAAGLISGGALSLHMLGKVLMNKDAARVLAAMASGRPMGMEARIATAVLAKGMANASMDLLNEKKEVIGALNFDRKGRPQYKPAVGTVKEGL